MLDFKILLEICSTGYKNGGVVDLQPNELQLPCKKSSHRPKEDSLDITSHLPVVIPVSENNGSAGGEPSLIPLMRLGASLAFGW